MKLIRNLLTALLVGLLLAWGKSAFAVDVTYEVAQANHDTYASTGGNNLNVINGANWLFGRFRFASVNYAANGYVRFNIDIPKGSTINSANLSRKCSGDYSSVFNTTIYGLTLSGSPNWRGIYAFGTINYSNGSALNAISVIGTSVAWNTPAAETTGTWYDTPDISTIVQALIDDANYDPSTAPSIGFKISEGDGVYAENDGRSSYQYDSSPANSMELDVSYTEPVAASGSQVIVVEDW